MGGGADQQPNTTRLPRENVTLRIVNQYGQVVENNPDASLTSSYNDDIDGRPGSLKPFALPAHKNSLHERVTPGHTARLRPSIDSSDRSQNHDSLYRIESGPQNHQRTQVIGKAPAK